MPHHLSARLAPPAAVFLVLALAACSASRTLPAEPDPLPRPSDGLLSRPDLQAVVDLGVLRDGPGLVGKLTEADPSVRARAAFVLGSVQDEATVPALITALRDSIPGVRADAAWAIGQTADSTAVPFLFMALRTEGTPAVQRQLMEAIGKLGTRDDGDELLRFVLARDREADRLLALARLAMRGRLSPGAFAVVAQKLRGPDPAAREMAAYVFARSDGWGAQGDLVREAFVELAKGERARFHLAQAIGRMRDMQDADRLADALGGDSDWHVRVKAAESLGAITESEDARDALFDGLDDEMHLVRLAAATALGSADGLPEAEVVRAERYIASRDTSDWHAAAALLPALAHAGRSASVTTWLDRHPNAFARAAGVAALGVADDPASLAQLLAFAAADEPLVRSSALDALGGRWRVSRERLDPAPIYDVLRAAIQSRDVAAVSSAAPVLADSLFLPFGSADLLRSSYRSMDNPADLEARIAILNTIGQLRDEGEIDFLLDIAIGGESPALQRAAVDALNDRLVEGIDVDLTTAAEAAVPTSAVDWDFLARLGSAPRMILTTTRGEIVIEMDPETAPQTVQSLTRTVREGRYDNVPFHRVVPAFVAQGGDYFRRDGWGGPETPIRSEFSRKRYRTGAAGMASSGRDTEGVQFFFMHAPHPHLDGRYTIWGEVVEGQEVVDQLRIGDVILSARVLPDLDTRVDE